MSSFVKGFDSSGSSLPLGPERPHGVHGPDPALPRFGPGHFVQGLPPSGHVQQGVLFFRTQSQLETSGHGGINELELDSFPDTLQMVVIPLLERVGTGAPSPFVERPLVKRAG